MKLTDKQQHDYLAAILLEVRALRDQVKKEQFDYLVKLNDGANDIGFVFANSWFDMFNPCFEILKIPVLDTVDFSKIAYEDVEDINTL